MIIREIHPGEIDNLLDICQMYADEASQTMPDVNEEFDAGVVIDNIRNWSIQHNYKLLVAFEGHDIVGFIGGAIIQLPYTRRHQANISYIFLKESNRTMDNFRSLLTAFEKWARQFQVSKIISGDIGIDIDRSRKLYNYLGFTEGLFVSKDLTYNE